MRLNLLDVNVNKLFLIWMHVLSLDMNSRSDVKLYNRYLGEMRFIGASSSHLLGLVEGMGYHAITPNTKSFNTVLSAMYKEKNTDKAQKLIQMMLQTRKESLLPDYESYAWVLEMLLRTGEIDAAFKYLFLILKSYHTFPKEVFYESVNACITMGRPDLLPSLFDWCKSMAQNKDHCPSWDECIDIAQVAVKEDNNKLACHALEFMAKIIARGEQEMFYAEEGLLVSALGTAGRTYCSTLLDASWKLLLLQCALHQKKAPCPESYLAKIYALASLGHLQTVFGTLSEFESAYENSDNEVKEEFFSPFTSLNPLAVACSERGFETLDMALKASRVFEHLQSKGVKPNATSYSLLVDAHLINRDPKSALSVIDNMVDAGFKPSIETLNKVGRRCIREMDNETYNGAVAIAEKFKIQMDPKSRWNLLFEFLHG